MPNQNSINSLDEALRIFWLESSQDSDNTFSDKELAMILSAPDNVYNMDETKRSALINRLYDSVNSISLGQLISEAFVASKIKETDLVQEVKIPLHILQEVKDDLVFPNSIPVMLLEGLLTKLGIVYKEAEKAIWKTFEIMKKKEYINLGYNASQVAFRRKQGDGGNLMLKKGVKADGRELYENRESVNKYLEKLKSLMPIVDGQNSEDGRTDI